MSVKDVDIKTGENYMLIGFPDCIEVRTQFANTHTYQIRKIFVGLIEQVCCVHGKSVYESGK